MITMPELKQNLADIGIKRTDRTIQRHLKALAEQYDLIREEDTKPFRYCWKVSAKGLSLPRLSNQESLLLMLAEQQLSDLLPVKLMRSMVGLFSQASDQLHNKSSTLLESEWLEKVRVVNTSQPLLPPKIDPDVFAEVSDALYGNRWLEVNYKNAVGKRTKTRVMPLGLAQQGPRMYLVCRFDGYDNERSLALHRITGARAQTLTFVRPKEFDLQKYDDEGRFGFGNGQRIQLSFRIEKPVGLHLLETPLSADQTVEELENCYKITATVVDSEMLEWWLRGFGGAINSVTRSSI